LLIKAQLGSSSWNINEGFLSFDFCNQIYFLNKMQFKRLSGGEKAAAMSRSGDKSLLSQAIFRIVQAKLFARRGRVMLQKAMSAVQTLYFTGG
jgi:hypothetical protein